MHHGPGAVQRAHAGQVAETLELGLAFAPNLEGPVGWGVAVEPLHDRARQAVDRSETMDQRASRSFVRDADDQLVVLDSDGPVADGGVRRAAARPVVAKARVVDDWAVGTGVGQADTAEGDYYREQELDHLPFLLSRGFAHSGCEVSCRFGRCLGPFLHLPWLVRTVALTRWSGR